MDTKQARLARTKLVTNYQQDIIIGSLLGDGHLVRTTRGFAFRVNHGIRQMAYVNWKYQALIGLTNSPPRTYQRSYYFRTVSHSYFDTLRRVFYSGRKKILPVEIGQWMTPLVFSVWLMDDGARDKGQVRLNTQSFSRRENQRLRSVLEASFGGIITTLNRDKDRFRLRVAAISMPRVRQVVAPFILPSMQYKLSP